MIYCSCFNSRFNFEIYLNWIGDKDKNVHAESTICGHIFKCIYGVVSRLNKCCTCQKKWCTFNLISNRNIE